MKTGDFIKPIDDIGEFQIIDIKSNLIIAKDEDGFEHSFRTSEVVLIQTDFINRMAGPVLQKDKPKEPKPSQKQKKKQKQKEWLEIDLHAGTLLGNTSGLSSHQILLLQLEEAEKALKLARKKGYAYLVLVHGKGKGRLRNELHKLLAKKEKLEFYDAEYSLFSSGATEVRFY